MSERQLKNFPVIGKIFVYQLKIIENVICIDAESDPDNFEVIEIRETPNGSKIYLTNKWNDHFNDIQGVHEMHVKEYISN